MCILKNYEQESLIQKDIIPYMADDPLGWAIKNAENEMNFWSKEKQILTERSAIIQLIKMQGWNEFDVSDETTNDTGHKHWMNFIGTKEEFEEFEKLLLNEE